VKPEIHALGEISDFSRLILRVFLCGRVPDRTRMLRQTALAGAIANVKRCSIFFLFFVVSKFRSKQQDGELSFGFVAWPRVPTSTRSERTGLN
jgi:hypothetical protein